MKYTHIFFDLGLTLVMLERGKRYQQVLKEFGIDKSIEEIEKVYHYADKLFMREYPGVLGKSPETFMPWYTGIVNYNLGVSLNLIETFEKSRLVANTYKTRWIAFEHSIETLKKLKEQGYKVGLISNWDSSCRAVLEQTGLLEYFDHTIISSEVGIEKPNPQIFERAFEIANVKAENALYVGDNYYDDVLGCEKVGMDCLLINPHNKFGIEEISYDKIISNSSEVFNYL